jgi:mevalonate kinase
MKLRITSNEDNYHFYGHGKLMITGEYFVLDGAQSLALPTKFGQHFRVRQLSSSDSLLHWIALDSQKKPWLQFTFDKENFACMNDSSAQANDLSLMLQATRQLNPDFLTDKTNTAVETLLEFPNNWGLGSSSTLIYCLAKWAKVNAYQLLQNSIGGSGYDVACAGSDTAILYQKTDDEPVTTPVNWQPDFSHQIYFAHLGKKQSSPDAIKYYKQQLKDKTHAINELNRITNLILNTNDFNLFEELIVEHETLIGSQLKLIKVKDQLFADYWGTAKSLGAWGGDFVMLTNDKSQEELKEYLQQKHITTFLSWEEMML